MTKRGSEISALSSVRPRGGRSLAKIAVPSVETAESAVKISLSVPGT